MKTKRQKMKRTTRRKRKKTKRLTMWSTRLSRVTTRTDPHRYTFINENRHPQVHKENIPPQVK